MPAPGCNNGAARLVYGPEKQSLLRKVKESANMRRIALAFVLLSSVVTASSAFASSGEPATSHPAKTHVTKSATDTTSRHGSKAKVASTNPVKKQAVGSTVEKTPAK
jgi:hypothetical protein